MHTIQTAVLTIFVVTQVTTEAQVLTDAEKMVAFNFGSPSAVN